MSDRRLYKIVGPADLTVGMTFIEQALTHQAIMEGILRPTQFVVINQTEFNGEEGFSFSCTVKEYLLN